ncbi:hypothetical protein GCM10009868_34090 [Terrabacter aerolatus]|uniref:ABM domain-containing protein n=1 Tax=Terrabacter aerolatus TaxID=422442 RepID=A0A512CWN7_9MICO|nr:antibiotic biosynthesis monooxygenase [Terrabacter aerolatus]GEO28607.1 hypothetical protein TAE01_04170 [Terrabacter aerolatus]
MADTWTMSDWSIGDADPEAFLAAFRRFADAATARGGAREGMILQDAHDPAHFVVVRRWESGEAVAAWAGEQARHSGELMELVPAGGSATVFLEVAELAPEGAATV